MNNVTNDNAIGLLVAIRGREETISGLEKDAASIRERLATENEALASERLAIGEELGIIPRRPPPPKSAQQEIVDLLSDGTHRTINQLCVALGKTYSQVSANLHWIMKRDPSPIVRVSSGVYAAASVPVVEAVAS